MKKLVSFLFAFSISTTAFAAPLSEYKGMPVVSVVVDGRTIQPEIPAYIDGGSTMLPLRAVSEALGADVKWDASSYTATVTMPKDTLTQEQIDRISKSVARIYVYDANEKPVSQGSGFIIDDGVHGKVLVTNHHVGSKGPNMRVELNGEVVGIRHQVLFQNAETDVLGVQIETKAPSIPYVTSLPKVGDPVTAIGYPHGKYKVSAGEVTRIYDGPANNNLETISSTAESDNGGSGGVLLNSDAEIIGITSIGSDLEHGSTSMAAKYIQRELDKLK